MTDTMTDSSENVQNTKLPLMQSIKRIITFSKFNIFLVFVPIGYIVKFVTKNDTLIFFMNFAAIIPLARLLGFATEELAESVGETLGGLLNATFGNAVELIIAIVALANGQIRVVQASMLGSVLSNILLVLGSCFLAGGIAVLRDTDENGIPKNLEQTFSSTAAQASSSLMTLSCITLILPAAFALAVNSTTNGNNTNVDPSTKILDISYGTSIVLLIVYILYLVFQLKTHKTLFNEKEGDKKDVDDNQSNKQNTNQSDDEQRGDSEQRPDDIRSDQNLLDRRENREREGEHNIERGVKIKDDIDDEPDEPEQHINVMIALILLIVTTVITAFSAEFLVDSIEGIVKTLGISETFVGLILLPIVGNAAEHVTSITVAIKDKMNLAIGVAVGSSTQIALFITPLLVILGWILNKPMSLYFMPFETVCLFIAVLLTNYLVQMEDQIG
ncbi:calcium/proton exchanger [Gigaspora margarita]|uniref:Calcium/proton exchanger n=2 Tax=Gigaspora margarita TaxID=4874 RepID=A0A8H3X242_GIGMA|nr:calcium/proton exchanger [Gigaspora margarita]